MYKLTDADLEHFDRDRGMFNEGYNPYPGMTIWSGGNLSAQLGQKDADLNSYYALPNSYDGYFQSNIGGDKGDIYDSIKNVITLKDPLGFKSANEIVDQAPGLKIMALPFAAAGISAGLGAAGAEAGAAGAGAGAAEGVGAGTGLDASTGLFAGESATSGAAGADIFSGSSEYASLLGDAGSDTAASMPAAQAEDVFGGYNFDPDTGDVFYGTGDNPYGANYSGGTGNEGYSGYQPGVLEQAQAQATALAKQLGVTPAAALQMVLKAAGRAAPAALGAVGANKQANSLEALANKYLEFGGPSRARYEASFAPGFTMANDPGYMDSLNQASKATLHGLSVGGNPAGSPNAWAQSLRDNYEKTAYPALQNFRNTNANAGGIASLQTSAPGFDANSVNASKGVFDAIGGGINDIFNPRQSLAQQLAEYKRLLGTAA